MDESGDNYNWRREYRIVFALGVAYIILLGLFTWFFNHSL